MSQHSLPTPSHPTHPPHPTQRRWVLWCQFMLAYTLLVILWGAWVRISHSGDGCGDSWPLCQQQVLPATANIKTWTEWFHRFMSGLFGIFVFGTTVFIFRRFPKGVRLRTWALIGSLFTLTEALLGAKLVLLGLVGSNDSGLRSFAMGLHLLNSILLVGALYMWIVHAKALSANSHYLKRSLSPFMVPLRAARKTAAASAIGFLSLVLTGAIASLSTTLFPARHFLESLQAQSLSTHYLMNLRSLHPFLGIVIGLAICSAALLFRNLCRESEKGLKQALYRLAIICLGTLSIGILTVLLASPVLLKLAHLLCMYVLWIALLSATHSIFFQLHLGCGPTFGTACINK